MACTAGVAHGAAGHHGGRRAPQCATWVVRQAAEGRRAALGPGVEPPPCAMMTSRVDVVPAPLAQSAEHSHGKAGVVGSIPTGGSPAA